MTARASGLRLAGLVAAWTGGVGLQLLQPALWPPAVYAAALVSALALAGASAIMPSTGVGRWRWTAGGVGWLAGTAAAAFALTGLHAHLQLAGPLAPALEGRDLVLTGVVASLPRAVPDGTRLVLDVESAVLAGPGGTGNAVAAPARVSLGWYSGGPGEGGPAEGPGADVRAGERWRLPVRLRQPHGTANPHGFDYELWLFEQGIRATGSVRGGGAAGAGPQRLADGAGHPVERWRQAARDAIYARVADPRTAGVLAALAVGDQAAIERGDWELFRATGIAHLMSISGVHVTMFGWLASLVLGRLWRRSGRLMLACPAPVAARWGGLLAAAGYALLAGWGVPAQRTVWMLATSAVLASLGVRWPWTLVLGVAAVVVTAIDPWALLQPGFWLSFAAVGLLLASAPTGDMAAADAAPPTLAARAGRLAHGALRTQAIATIGLAPLSLVFFQQISLVGFVANLVAIPLVTLWITPLALAGLVAPPLWQAAAAAVELLAQALTALASLPLVVWSVGVAPPWAQAAGLLGGLLLVVPVPRRVRVLALPLALPLLWPVFERPAAGRFELVAADVGQGSAVLVRTREHLLVYDTGPQYSRERDAGERVLLPLLRARGEHRIDLLMLSHRDTDHVGGAAALLAGLPVTRLSSSLEPGHPLLASGVPHDRCDAGQRWAWDGVSFEVLAPPAADHAKGLASNALSCVLRVEAADGSSALLAGDIEAAQEAALVQRAGDRLASDVLLVPHHGSKTSSTDAFIDAVAPRVAVVQAGYRNRFGHPAAPVVERYAARAIELVRSDDCGAWSWREGAAHCQREVVRRYWQASPPQDAAPPSPPVAWKLHPGGGRPLPISRESLWPSTSR